MNSFSLSFFFSFLLLYYYSLHTLTTYYSYTTTLTPLSAYSQTPTILQQTLSNTQNKLRKSLPTYQLFLLQVSSILSTHTHTLHAINVVTNTLHRSKTKRKRTSSRTVGRCASACLATRRTEEQKNTPSTSRTHLIHDADSKHETTERRY